MSSRYEQLWIYFFISFLCVFQVECYLNLISDIEVSSVYQRSAELLCKVDSDKSVKEISWYRLSNNQPRKLVYFYEPPKFNSSAPDYKGRAQLAPDLSSLILHSVSLDDETIYECRVRVVENATSPNAVAFPEEKSVTMKLNVYVPPKDVKLSTFHSGKNLTLTCQSHRSKPPAVISWVITKKDGTSRELSPSKVITEFQGNLADTSGYLYWSLLSNQNGTVFTCIVSHPDTATLLERDVSLVSPALLHSVNMMFDWLGASVPYATYKNTVTDTKEAVPGLVRIDVHPGQVVKYNSTIVATVSAKGAFPEPSYTWWAEELGQSTGKQRLVKIAQKNINLFCLVENPVGRAVMSVEITASSTDPTQTGSDPSQEPMEGGLLASGAVVAAIAFGGLLVVFLLAFLIYYFGFKRPSDKKHSGDDAGVVEENDFETFVEKPKQAFTSNGPSDQPQGVRMTKDEAEPLAATRESDPLLMSASESPPPPFHSRSGESTPVKQKDGKHSRSGSSATTTSGYSDTGNGRNDTEVDGTQQSPPSGRERAITKHLQDFDENASFLGEYGSTFALDNAPPPRPIEVEARTSPFDGSDVEESYSDASSIDSGASGHEGRYTLPHSSSWEEIRPHQTVNTPV